MAVLLVGLGSVLAACKAPVDEDSGPTPSPEAVGDDAAEEREQPAAVEPEPCGPASFRPSHLPWSDVAGDPDAVVVETDQGWGAGVTSMWWWERTPEQPPDGAGVWPWSEGDDLRNRYVILQRGVDSDALRARGVDTDSEEPDGTVRGHPAVFAATGDPGVGAASIRWAESAGRCDHYLLILQPWQTEAELWTIVPSD